MGKIYFQELCSSDSDDWLFWSSESVWYTSSPDFTLCFQYTILNWIPIMILLLSSVISLPSMMRMRNIRYIKRGTFNIFKSVIITFILMVHILNLCMAISDQVNQKYPPLALFLTPVLSAMAMVLLLFLNRTTFNKGIHTSGSLLLCWFILLITNTIELYSKYRKYNLPEADIFRTTTKTIEFVLVLISFICNCFADRAVFQNIESKEWTEDNCEVQPLLKTKYNSDLSMNYEICPEEQASFLSKITYSWLGSLIVRGYRQPLTTNDLYSLRESDTCATIVPKMITEYNIEIDKTTEGSRFPIRDKYSNGGYQSLSTEIPKTEDDQQEGNKKQNPSFTKALFHAIGHEFAFAGLYRFIYDMSNFLMPMILGAFIAFIEDLQDYLWHGVVFVLSLFIVAMFRTILYQYFLHVVLVTGMRARTAIIGIIYRKALRLSATSRKGSTVGQIVNLMAVDSQKVQDVAFHLHQVWSAPVTILVAFYFLWQQLGPSVLAGLALLLCLIPLNVYIGSRSKALQIQQMRMKDKRIKMMSEILNGMKILKLYAWEQSFEEKIKEMRNQECKILRKAMYLNSFSAVSWFCAPLLVTLASFAVYVLSSPTNILNPTIAFVSISLINIINIPISLFPGSFLFTIQALVSVKRIGKFLTEEELDPDNVEDSPYGQDPLKIIDGNFSWGKSEEPILTDINMEVTEGSLVAIVGTVGSGKSSLMSAMLGEMNKIKGKVMCRGSIAYVPQQAWCQNASVQDNILFGRAMSRNKYDRVLENCALEQDLRILPAGDETEIGEKGINLSGGQKQRISLARSVYQDADIYLFDDPLSAVDSHVGKHIFNKVIGPEGQLNTKTRVLITHGLTYLPKVDKIFVVKEGRISEAGTYRELLNNDGPFAEFLRTYLENDEDDNEVEEDDDSEDEERQIKIELRKKLSQCFSPRGESDVEKSVGHVGSGSSSFFRRQHRKRTSAVSSKGKINSKDTEPNKAQKNKLIADEIAQIGGVKLSVFISYLRSATYYFAAVVIVSYSMYLVSSVVANIFLSSWSELGTVNGTQDPSSRDYYLGVYGGLGIVQAIFILVQNFAMAYGTFLASQTLHHLMLRSIIRAPNMFFDVTPSGRILNRIGKDIDTVDVNIPTAFRIWLTSGARVISSVLLVVISSPYFILALIPLSLIYFFIQRFYICTSRQLKRIDSIKRSPIYSHFQESIIGAPSIRAYKATDTFIERCDVLTDQNQMAWYPNIVSYRWMQFYLETIGNIMILLAGVFAILTRDSIGPGLAGLSVSYSFQITTGLAVMVRTACDLESYVVAVERIQEYAEIAPEAPWSIDETKPSYDWPTQGKVEFCNYSVRYRPGLDLVLRNLNLIINPGEKVGIVGRTGAGKSSLALALFRLIEPAEGSILIDDVDIVRLGLHSLRSKITIIPQDPVLFSGTLRMNLDPFKSHSDAELWTALDSAHLKSFVSKMPQGLEYTVSESGDNLSVGQRQLVCLARALLKKTKVLILDEATAAVDFETDDLIQTSIRRQFKTCTVLTIAHRLNTILDYDKVIVLDQGRIKEVDTPSNLLANERSIFAMMAHDAGII